MEPRDVTRELLKAVEAESGFPVHVREDANLATVTSARLARDPLPAHMIAYRPDGGAPCTGRALPPGADP